MATIQYGDDLLQITRVQAVDMEPVYDPSGNDFLYSKILLDVHFIWQPNATASNVGRAAAAPFDSLGVSVLQLRERLNSPRRLLRVTVGNDVVWEVPAIDVVGNRLPCDVGGGPHPKLLSLTEIEGEFMAAGRWRVVFHKARRHDILLSNRWTVRAVTGETGHTQRVIDGWAVMRKDFVNYSTIVNIDDLRNWLFCPCPLAFRRSGVDVLMTELGDRGKYRVTDTEDPNPMGLFGGGIGAASFEGEATAGGVTKFKTTKDRIGAVFGAVGKMIQGDFLGVANITLQSILPDQMASCWVQVNANKNVLKSEMVKLAIQIALDRFLPVDADVVGCFVTQGLGKREDKGRWVKVVMTFFPTLSALTGQALDFTKVSAQMNYNNSVKPLNPDGTGVPTAGTFPGDTPIVGIGPPDLKYQNENMPRGSRPGDASGDRGSWVGSLLLQALQKPFDATVVQQPVPAPPDEKQVIERNRIP